MSDGEWDSPSCTPAPVPQPTQNEDEHRLQNSESGGRPEAEGEDSNSLNAFFAVGTAAAAATASLVQQVASAATATAEGASRGSPTTNSQSTNRMMPSSTNSFGNVSTSSTVSNSREVTGENNSTNNNDSYVVGEYGDKACPICLERYTESNPAIVYPCNHTFHFQCAESWYQRNGSCAVCLKTSDPDAGRVMTPRDIKRTRTPRDVKRAQQQQRRSRRSSGGTRASMGHGYSDEDSENDDHSPLLGGTPITEGAPGSLPASGTPAGEGDDTSRTTVGSSGPDAQAQMRTHNVVAQRSKVVQLLSHFARWCC